MRAEGNKALRIVSIDPGACERIVQQQQARILTFVEQGIPADTCRTQTLGKVTREYSRLIRQSEADRDFAQQLSLLLSICIWGLASMDTYQEVITLEPSWRSPNDDETS